MRKYMKYFINFLKNVKFNPVHNVIYKTFAVFGCPTFACSRDGARDFFCYSPVNNALSPSRADACEGDSLISSISRDTLSTNKKGEKENFDDWYIILNITLPWRMEKPTLTRNI